MCIQGMVWCVRGSADESHKIPTSLSASAIKDTDFGVPTVAQRVKNPTSIHEDAGSISGLTHGLRAQWAKDLALP